MATKKRTRADLIQQREALDAAIKERYREDLRVLVDQFRAHLATGQFELADALAMLRAQPIRPGKGPGKGRAAGTKTKPKADGERPVSGVTYKHPQTGEEWTAPKNLRRAKKWLQDLASSPGKKYEDFAVGG